MLIKLEIDRKSIENNLKKIKEINENIICVLKDDAYGLGLENILPILIENGFHYFAVAYVEEALKIKEIINEKYKSELENIKIMTLNFIEDRDLEKALKNHVEITLFSMEQLESYRPVFQKLKVESRESNNRSGNENDSNGGIPVKIHIKVNTGMNRLGFNEDETDPLAEKLIRLKEEGVNIEIKSVYSHVSNSEDKEETELQIEKYENILKRLKGSKLEYGNETIKRHIQASPLLFKYKEKYNYDFARIGMAIYGMEPLSEKVGLESTVRLVSKVISIRNVKKGDSVSYGKNGIVTEDKKVAVIPIGYAHGLKKQIENSNPYVLINGEKAPIMGEVCMDMIIADVSRLKEIKVNDEAVIIGKQRNLEITLLEMAGWAHTIQDDILTSWNKSVQRTVK